MMRAALGRPVWLLWVLALRVARPIASGTRSPVSQRRRARPLSGSDPTPLGWLVSPVLTWPGKRQASGALPGLI